ncbi:MAG TPA: hypothetical protein PLG23_12805 [Thermoflexales bacterium]|jgi:hypothetical protein|nr:hypothetical protein [Anaerolineales bacterium]HQZ54341.1 hypothetical protein [Thermoflexales bacterium]
MKLSKSNRFLRSPKAAASALWVSAKTSSAVEGIRQPFADGPFKMKTPTAAALVEYWKQRASKSGR